MNLLKSILVVGDRVLIEPNPSESQTKSGLFLPATIKEKEEIRSGKIIRVGPGYPIHTPHDPDDFYKEDKNQVQYLPLQVKEGDEVLYLKNSSYEVEYEGQKYIIAPQNAILLVIRDALSELNI